MDHGTHSTEAATRIDLTRQTDVLYWCRIFSVSMEQLRDAVHHAGHTPDAVGRYIREHNLSAS